MFPIFNVVSVDFDVTVVIIVSSTVVLSSIDVVLADVFPLGNMDVLEREVISLSVVEPADIDASTAVVELSGEVLSSADDSIGVEFTVVMVV